MTLDEMVRAIVREEIAQQQGLGTAAVPPAAVPPAAVPPAAVPPAAVPPAATAPVPAGPPVAVPPVAMPQIPAAGPPVTAPPTAAPGIPPVPAPGAPPAPQAPVQGVPSLDDIKALANDFFRAHPERAAEVVGVLADAGATKMDDLPAGQYIRVHQQLKTLAGVA